MSILPLGPPVSGAQRVGLDQLGSNRPERSVAHSLTSRSCPNPNPRALATRASPPLRRISSASSGHRRRRDWSQSNGRTTAHRSVRADPCFTAVSVRPQRLCGTAVVICGAPSPAVDPGVVVVLERPCSVTPGQARLGAAVVACAAVPPWHAGALLQVHASNTLFLPPSLCSALGFALPLPWRCCAVPAACAFTAVLAMDALVLLL